MDQLKVNDKRKKDGVPLHTLTVGTVFEYNSRLYVLTSGLSRYTSIELKVEDTQYNNRLCLQLGVPDFEIIGMAINILVHPVSAEIIIN